MEGEPNLVRQLSAARDLLLTPNPDAMRQCEERLKSAIQQIHSETRPLSREVKTLAHTLRFLLNKADEFWQLRHETLQPAAHYSPLGLLRSIECESTFVVEV